MRKKKHIKVQDYYPYQLGKIVIPIQLVELEDSSFHLIVRANINGINGDMIIDTGASITVADQTLFINPSNDDCNVNILSGGVNGKIEDVKLVNLKQFYIGNREIKNIKIASIDLGYVNEMYEKYLNRKVIGLLGSDFFVRYRASINYDDKTLSLFIKKHEIR